MDYGEFFQTATKHAPLRYQERFQSGCGDLTLLEVPTGLGKTNTVLVDWLYRLVPRRLIWCLPGRALTEQIFLGACELIHNLGLQGRVRVCRLMGGSTDNDGTLGPDEPAILVGTQDILISRALNRGYARRPFRWPIDFALLNNDCYWVFDEVQLLGDALATSTQLAAFRSQFGCFGPVQCCWMSATVQKEWLGTVDFGIIADQVTTFRLNDGERKQEFVKQRYGAAKRLELAPVECRMPSGAADFVIRHHRAGTRSIAVANTVSRAREIWGVLRKRSKTEPLLLHSRFRAADRLARMRQVTERKADEDQILVATQVIEAGIDISAAFMLTDIAPYSSLVQRFGRVNRQGEDPGSEIFWVDRPLTEKRKSWSDLPELKLKEGEVVSAPYTPVEIASTTEILRNLRSASPQDLPPVNAPPPWDYVLRRADLLDLFDTTPDLAGNEIDISRFVRSGEDKDVYVAWREWEEASEAPPEKLSEIREEELCPAPIGEVRDFVKKHPTWIWDALEGKWQAAKDNKLYPGVIVLAHVSAGGYTPQSGWWPDSGEPVPALEKSGSESEGLDSDPHTYVSYRQSLVDHTNEVCAALGKLFCDVAIPDLESYRGDLEIAARKHDWGKAHPVMQRTLHNSERPYTELLAKQKREDADHAGHSRRHFRHEFASALAMLKERDSDLSAYVVAAHHGKVRMSLRSMPGERLGEEPIARGVKEGDVLLSCDLGGGVMRDDTRLNNFDAMLLGSSENQSRSWTDRMLQLRDALGPFRLAYLEMLLRIADERASKGAGERLTR